MQVYLQEAMPERTYLLTVGIIAYLHSIDDNSFCLDIDRCRSTASCSMERDSAGIEPGQCDGAVLSCISPLSIWAGARLPPRIQTCFNRKYGRTQHDGSHLRNLGTPWDRCNALTANTGANLYRGGAVTGFGRFLPLFLGKLLK